jgi:hypothetical protein
MESAAVVPCCCYSAKADEGFFTNVTVAVSSANAVGRCASRKESVMNIRDFMIAVLRRYPKTSSERRLTEREREEMNGSDVEQNRTEQSERTSISRRKVEEETYLVWHSRPTWPRSAAVPESCLQAAETVTD